MPWLYHFAQSEESPLEKASKKRFLVAFLLGTTHEVIFSAAR
jgi:hypothetical protein